MPKRTLNVFSTNNLKKVEKLIWDFFQQGVKNKRSAFHYPTIATSSEKSFNLRTVILRKVIREDYIIFFYTDHRSKKIVELKNNNQLLLHVYDKKNEIQIQAEGKVKILNKVKLNQLTWNSLSNYAKQAYLTKKAPGKKIIDNKDLEYFNNQDGYKNFTIVKVKINKIIFFQLNKNGNKKILVKYGKKNINYHWLVP